MALFTPDGREVDVAINGIPFMLATEQNLPQTVETQQVRKDQFDTEQDPGEQSLAGYWRRSQASFHEGAGNLYQEASDSNVAGNGFFDSRGVDVFTTKGKVSLLKAMSSLGTTSLSLSRLRTYGSAATRINLVPNPSFEVDTTGWTTAGTTAIARDTTQSRYGSASLLTTWNSTSTANRAITNAITVTNGANYRAAIHVMVPVGSTACTIKVVSGGTTTTGSVVPADGVWRRLSVLFTAAATTATVALAPDVAPTVGHTAYLDGVHLELDNGLGSYYFDGSFADASWSGTAHNSTSILGVADGNFFLSAVGVVTGSGSLYRNSGGSFAIAHNPTARSIVDGIIAGDTFYDVSADGILFRGSLTAPSNATQWSLGTATVASRVGWGKHRLWVIGPRKIWQPDMTLAAGTTQEAIFTHPSIGWKYTCMAEGPAAMYFGGHDGFNSSIQAVTVDTDLSVPFLSGAAVTAVLPDGELVQEIATLAGQFIGIGTSRGFRVGRIDGNGTITYGPLLFEGSVTAITGLDRYFMVATNGSSIIKKVDTATEVSEGVFAYANDVEGGTGTTPNSITNNNGTVAFTTTNGDTYTQSSNYVTTGYVQSGRIRFRTTEDKSFKYADVEIEPLPTGASVVTDLILQDGTSSTLGTISTLNQQQAAYSISAAPQRYVSVKITLNKGTSATPSLNSYLLRALPASTPHRIITLPLLCFDREKSRSGQFYGAQGYAQSRLAQLQALEDDATTVPYQNFADTNDGSINVVIESIRFVQTSPPRSDQRRGDGGVLILTLKTVPI